MTRRDAALCGAFLAIALLLAAAPRAVASPGARLVVAEPVHEFGAVVQGTLVQHSFALQNQGAGDLHIDGVVAPCGCTVAVLSDHTVPPGGAAELHVTFDTARFGGRKTKKVSVSTDDPDQPVVELTLTGEVAAWGLPGLYGCEIWAEQVNANGGIKIGSESYNVQFVSYDDEYLPDKALQGAKKLVLEDGVKFIMMLGGDPWPGVQPFANEQKMLVSTLLPSDLSPNTPYLIASQGSSGSDQPFMRAIPYTLAAFRPEVKRKLIDNGLLMPTLQMILRQANKQIREEVERGVFDVAAVKAANDNLIGTIEETLAIADQAKARRATAESDLRKMEEELRTTLASARSRRTPK